jgi:ATP-dependent DNA helicase RecG
LNNLLDNKIEFLKGVGPKRAAILNKELNIYTYNDLLNYFPFRHIDKSRIYNVTEIDNDNIYYQIAGRIDNIKSFGPRTAPASAPWQPDTRYCRRSSG